MVTSVTFFSILFLITRPVYGQYRDDRCRLQMSRANGRCILIRECPYAIEQVRRGIYPEMCGFLGIQPIVCCPFQNVLRPNPPTRPTPVTPAPQLLSRSAEKCKEYTVPEDIPVSYEITPVLTVVGGTKASAEEFPHMAVLGFGDENEIQWLCGGTLISENYVLTAAHCTASQEFGEVKFVRLGDLNLKLDTDDAQPQTLRVSEIHRYPDYKPPSQYHDIALLKLSRPASFTKYVRPACLHTTRNLPEHSPPIATGWGKLGFVGDSSDDLMKVTLTYYTNERCKEVYANTPARRLQNGIADDLQICAGGLNNSKDTCQGDSGGPLQARSLDNFKLFYVVGITSFGKGCGVINTPGVYTRVSNYINWIEDIVWPN
ncbi:hypothetical protein RI129_000747 [Pyrocoelia pectoralis]|uniref:Serine protease snake n=1 Tax=Pyrocoelia pectoralis TaxID=417401 RepID=A0AAN7ZWB8_9COLE